MSSEPSRPADPVMDWPYKANRPQRYSINYNRYLSLGGPARLEELVGGFVTGGANQHDMARFYFFCLTFDQLAKEGLDGDLAELGAYKGHTATLLAAMARKLGKTAYVLDTFEGFNKGDLKGIDSAAKAGVFGDTSLEAVRTLVGEGNTRFVKGYFPETASQLPAEGRYCLVHIDCDLYAPIKSALEYFYPRMVPGGFLIIHDYSSLYWSGAEKAVDEFFADKIEPVVPLPDSAGSVVVRKARVPEAKDNWLIRKRALLLREEWVEAGNGGLRELLGVGWSGPEAWGVWGVGEAHELHLVLPSLVSSDIELDMDVHVALVGSRTSQQVDVCGGVDRLTTWEFTAGNNRGVRSVRLPAERLRGMVDQQGLLTLVFRPHTTESPSELQAGLQERRPLGLALHRMRCRRATGPA
jgi:hypothetical protein